MDNLVGDARSVVSHDQPKQKTSIVQAVSCGQCDLLGEKRVYLFFSGGPVAQIKLKLFFSEFFDKINSDKWLTPHRVFYEFY